MFSPVMATLKSKINLKQVNLQATNSIIKEIFNKLDLPLLSASSPPIPGVFNGKWGGSGPIIESVDPGTNKVISKIQSVMLFFLLQLLQLFRLVWMILMRQLKL